MSVYEYFRELEDFKQTQLHLFNNFKYYQNLSKCLVYFTLITTYESTSTNKDMYIAKILLHEMSRIFCDRVLFPDYRKEIKEKLAAITRDEFLVRTLEQPNESLLFGNYHELYQNRRLHVNYKDMTSHKPAIKS
jgi:hypothetical protein